MSQLQLKIPFAEAKEGNVLDPQPYSPSQGRCLDHMENYQKPGEFTFYEGDELNGHTAVLTVQAPSLTVEPVFDYEMQIWRWKRIRKELLDNRKWWSDRI